MSSNQTRSETWVRPEGSWASSAGNRKSMLGNRNRDTSPELALRSLVHAAGLRYRVAAKPLPKMRRTADLVFRPSRVAVFVDGCYWHGCPQHFVLPKTNPDYWREKIGRNMARDSETDERLKAEGWLALRFWEHEPAEQCAAAVWEAVTSRRLRPRVSQMNILGQ
jgi:DNA mismatch endonuclease (patch repair protein)